MDRYVPTSASLQYPCSVFRVVYNNSDALFQENDVFSAEREKKKGNNILPKLATSYTTTVNNEEKGQTYFLLIFVFFWKPHDENSKIFCYKLSKVHDECLKCKFSLFCKQPLITVFKSL